MLPYENKAFAWSDLTQTLRDVEVFAVPTAEIQKGADSSGKSLGRYSLDRLMANHTVHLPRGSQYRSRVSFA